MIFKALDSIRNKPSHVRSLYALGASLSFTLVIGFFWFASYSSYVREVFSKAESQEVAGVPAEGAEVKTGAGFFNKLRSSVSSAFGEMKGQFSALSSVITPPVTSSSTPTGTVSEQASTTDQGIGLQYSATSTGSSTENLIEYSSSTRSSSTSDSI